MASFRRFLGEFREGSASYALPSGPSNILGALLVSAPFCCRGVSRFASAHSLAPRSLAPRSLAPCSLASRSLASRSPLARLSLSARSLAPRSLAPRTLARAPLVHPRSLAPRWLAPRLLLNSERQSVPSQVKLTVKYLIVMSGDFLGDELCLNSVTFNQDC